MLEVSGVHPLAPAARDDSMGLVSLIRGSKVVEIVETRATIRTQSSSQLTYRRRIQPSAVAVWELRP
jgi:hypothetical protein